jgi:spermidine dehydrogenase
VAEEERGDAEEDRALGMDRRIQRRDFLQGMALGAAALGLARRGRGGDAPAPATTAASGLAGQDPAAMALGHRLREGELDAGPGAPAETGEEYELVVVGAGIAGLTAAYAYDRETRGRARILILDNHGEFGGHARRNVFHHDATTLVAQGGVFAFESPEATPGDVAEMLAALGVDAGRMEALRDAGFEKRYGLSQGVFFDPRVWPGARASWVTGFYDRPYEAFFAQAPIPDAARRELVSLYTTRRDYLPGLHGEARAARLASMSWEQLLRGPMGLSDAAVRFCNLYATDLVGLGCDAVSALAGWKLGPGFAGMEGPGFVERNGVLAFGYEPTARFPDGNHTIARALLKRLIPAALGGDASIEGVFGAALDASALDRPQGRVRLRLRSLAMRVAHEGAASRPAGVVVDYVQAAGGPRRVRARSAVVATWGMAARRIVPELPPAQRAALEAYRYTACLYVNVFLRHWRFAAAAGVFDMFFPGGWATWGHIADPLAIGGYRPDYRPDAPTVLSLYRYLHKPGMPPDDQMVSTRVELEQMSFASLEREIRRELREAFGPWGLDPARDVLGITVNRWGHGYCFFSAPGQRWEDGEAPWEIGRRRLGRISFAGADAGGEPWTQGAMAEAQRAALEQLDAGG